MNAIILPQICAGLPPYESFYFMQEPQAHCNTNKARKPSNTCRSLTAIVQTTNMSMLYMHHAKGGGCTEPSLLQTPTNNQDDCRHERASERRLAALHNESNQTNSSQSRRALIQLKEKHRLCVLSLQTCEHNKVRLTRSPCDGAKKVTERALKLVANDNERSKD